LVTLIARELIGERARAKLGVTKMVIIALAVIIILGSTLVAYIELKSSSPYPTLSHVVSWQEMANYTLDYWNVTASQPYTITLKDSMTTSSSAQWLLISAFNSSSLPMEQIWYVEFENTTRFYYATFVNNNQKDAGSLNCNNGNVTIIVTNTSITFTGTSSFTSYVPFSNLEHITTGNDDGIFTGGELNFDLR
jgi:hypothetical protein